MLRRNHPTPRAGCATAPDVYRGTKHALPLVGLPRGTASVATIHDLAALAEPIFAFPDLSALAPLAGRTMPFFYTYYVPGRSSHEAEPAVLARLEALAPRVAVVGRPRVPAFAGADTYFGGILAYLAAHYDTAARTDGCDVLVRRAEATGGPIMPR